MDLSKEINSLFSLNRNDLNSAHRKIEKILLEVYAKGKKAGRKEEIDSVIIFMKRKR